MTTVAEKGRSSGTGGARRTLKGAARLLGILACAAVLGLVGVRPSPAAQATVSWDAVSNADLAGYKVHFGTSSGSYSTHIDAGNVVTRVIDNLAANTAYYFVVTAYDIYGGESANSAEIVYTPPLPAETVSTPAAASGPTNGTAGERYDFATGGAVSSTGDPVQYQFFWSDGTASGWLPTGTNTASKAWPTPGTYSDIRVQARCANHPSVLSSLSGAVAVVVSAAPAETVSIPFTPVGPVNGLAGQAYAYATGGAFTSEGDPVQYRFAWADGTDSGWLPVGVIDAWKAWPAPGTYSDVRVEARCAVHPSVVSSPSWPLTVSIAAGAVETVSSPSAPAGPAQGNVGNAYAFTSAGAVSDAGDPVQYRFHWGDGSASEWIVPGPATAWKSWDTPGTYRVHVEAACVLHPTATALSPEVEIVIGGVDPLLFSDDFHDGGLKGDPDWQSYRGTWKVRGETMSLTTPTGARTLFLARPVSDFAAGRLSFLIKLRPTPTRGARTGLVFSAAGLSRYRYVAFSTSRIIIGQLGSTPLVKAGVKRSVASPLKFREWHQVDVSLLPDGTVEVYLDGAVEPIASYRFDDVVPGMVGFFCRGVPASYDDFAVRDEGALF